MRALAVHDLRHPPSFKWGFFVNGSLQPCSAGDKHKVSAKLQKSHSLPQEHVTPAAHLGTVQTLSLYEKVTCMSLALTTG